jgi:hypothetical protein
MPILKPSSAVEKKTRTVVDTILLTPDSVMKWISPPFQRPVKENDKVRALAEQLKEDGGVLPGIITLGVLDSKTYIVDGQHRRAAFLISGLDEGYTDVRTHFFKTMADMGEEFVNLNSQLVRMRPDDMLRGLESSLPLLARIREYCPFVGYDMIRRGANSPIVSMSAVMRQWRASSFEVPSLSASGLSSAVMAQHLTEEEAQHLINFLHLAVQAFGRDPEYVRLWGALNMTMCMWLYRRMVLGLDHQHHKRTERISPDLFKKCLMALSANGDYLDWLVGRNMSDRDRSPAYTKIKHAFAKRIFTENGKKPALPSPVWHSNKGIAWDKS